MTYVGMEEDVVNVATLASLTGQVTMHFVSNPRNHFLHVIIVIPLLNRSHQIFIFISYYIACNATNYKMMQ